MQGVPPEIRQAISSLPNNLYLEDKVDFAQQYWNARRSTHFQLMYNYPGIEQQRSRDENCNRKMEKLTQQFQKLKALVAQYDRTRQRAFYQEDDWENAIYIPNPTEVKAQWWEVRPSIPDEELQKQTVLITEIAPVISTCQLVSKLETIEIIQQEISEHAEGNIERGNHGPTIATIEESYNKAYWNEMLDYLEDKHCGANITEVEEKQDEEEYDKEEIIEKENRPNSNQVHRHHKTLENFNEGPYSGQNPHPYANHTGEIEEPSKVEAPQNNELIFTSEPEEKVAESNEFWTKN